MEDIKVPAIDLGAERCEQRVIAMHTTVARQSTCEHIRTRTHARRRGRGRHELADDDDDEDEEEGAQREVRSKRLVEVVVVHVGAKVRELAAQVLARVVLELATEERDLRVLEVELVGESADGVGERLDLALELEHRGLLLGRIAGAKVVGARHAGASVGGPRRAVSGRMPSQEKRER